MLNKKIIGENFSRAAQNYEAVALVQKQAAEKLCHLASPFIRDDLRILDLGSGTGFVSRSLNNLQNGPRNKCGVTIGEYGVTIGEYGVTIGEYGVTIGEWGTTTTEKKTPICCFSPNVVTPHSPLVTPHLLRGPLVFEADLSLSMLQQHPNNFKINCDFENLPFRNHSFDILISSFSLQWLSDFEKNFLQFSALLKPHGIFAFCIPTDKSLEELKLASIESGCDFHFNILPKISDLKSALKKCGFEERLLELEVIKSEFTDAFQALKSIKKTGANYTTKRKFVSKTQLTQFHSFCLKNFSQPNKKISISWNVSFFIFQKLS